MRILTRRLFRLSVPAALVVASLAFAAGILVTGSDAEPQPVVGNLELPESNEPKFPIIYDGQSITFPEDVQFWTNFEPLFGKYRPSVNPADLRVVNGRELVFDKPGEYYILLNSTKPIKVLVLSHSESISDSVVRLFDFLTANLLVTRGHGELYREDPDGYTASFFRSPEPGLLLCGPTLALFQRLVHDRFRLPVRDVTYTGTYMQGGKVNYSTHNLVEIYLPDKKNGSSSMSTTGFS